MGTDVVALKIYICELQRSVEVSLSWVQSLSSKHPDRESLSDIDSQLTKRRKKLVKAMSVKSNKQMFRPSFLSTCLSFFNFTL